MQCPLCGGTGLTLMKPRSLTFQLGPNRRCDACGAVWRPACPKWGAAVSILVGLVLGPYGIFSLWFAIAHPEEIQVDRFAFLSFWAAATCVGFSAFYYGISAFGGKASRPTILKQGSGHAEDGDPVTTSPKERTPMLKGLTFFIAMLVGGVIGGFIGATETGGTGTVTASRFVLLDESGNVKGEWGMNTVNEQLLRMNPAGGTETVLRIGVLDNDPAIILCNPNGSFRISLGLYKGEALLQFRDDLGNIRTSLGDVPNNDKSLFLFDAQGNTTFEQ